MIRKITFNEEQHSYKDEYYSYMGCTTYLSKFERPFDGYFWTRYKAAQVLLEDIDPNWWRIKKALLDDHSKIDTFVNRSSFKQVILRKAEEIAEEWEQARLKGLAKGSKYHKEKEDEAYEKGHIIHNHKTFDTIAQYNYDLASLPDGFYAELLIYWAPLRLCGTADKVFIETINGVRYIDIDDYKTNKKIKTDSYDRMLPPLSHIWQNTKTKYELQISFYAYMLELWGYTIRDTRFTHATGIIDVPYDFKYRRDDIKKVFEYREKELC